MGLWYPKDSGFELIAFSDADHVGCLDTRKSTYGGIQFLSDKFVNWMSKKQDCIAMSSAEAEYVVLSASSDPEMCMFVLTVSTAQPKTIKEAMADFAWIEAMQEDLYQESLPSKESSIWIEASFKIQDCIAMSSAEAEYVVLSASCAQVIWMRIQLKDYGFNYNKISLYCDSQSTITIVCNPVQHSRTKHIHTRYHFIKEQDENGILDLYFVRTEYQLADMFTKALPEDRFQYLFRRIGMRCLTPAELEVLVNESA
nr:putative RNA-directed DNA polymerase [Tanacetum cinerariifolium]